uniref:Large ribosomal subunit protein bL9m n=1 Tax=Panagrolaimus sp. PS1159 TaxID=55785 RepID=A0AC35EW55_9BILA
MNPICSKFIKPTVNTICRRIALTQTRNTYIFRHVYVPPATPEGQHQRPPSEIQNYRKYEIVEEETEKPAGPLKVILLQDVEGIGHQFDIVEVDRDLARNDLLITKKAAYASPFDLKYYGDMKERMKEELAKRVRIPYKYLKIGRELQKLVVPLHVSMDNPWTLNRSIVTASLRQMGVDVLDNGVFLPKETISGPNFDYEAKLTRFYVVINKQYVVPMIGRISHISADESKQALYPDAAKQPSEEQLRKFGIKPETPYFHSSPEIDENFVVVDLMNSRKKQ